MCEPVDSWLETANAVAQPFRQHRNHAVGQIHAIPAPARFAIQRAAGFYVRGDIGNVHTEPPTAVGLLNLNSVIEIPRIIRINCNDEFLAQIFPAFELP